ASRRSAAQLHVEVVTGATSFRAWRVRRVGTRKTNFVNSSGVDMEIIRNLARRKLRSTLTILGIVIGIFALTTMGAMAEHFNALIDGGVTYFGSNVQVGSPDGQASILPISKMDELKQVDGVDAVFPSYS